MERPDYSLPKGDPKTPSTLSHVFLCRMSNSFMCHMVVADFTIGMFAMSPSAGSFVPTRKEVLDPNRESRNECRAEKKR
jgi:hypothetical protein